MKFKSKNICYFLVLFVSYWLKTFISMQAYVCQPVWATHVTIMHIFLTNTVHSLTSFVHIFNADFAPGLVMFCSIILTTGPIALLQLRGYGLPFLPSQPHAHWFPSLWTPQEAPGSHTIFSKHWCVTIKFLVPHWVKCLNVNDDYLKVWCVPLLPIFHVHIKAKIEVLASEWFKLLCNIIFC